MKPKGLKKFLKKATTMLTLTAMITLSILNVFPASALIIGNNNKTKTGTGEIVAKRGEFEKHFQNEDGTITVATYASPIHYKGDNGEWIDIDNTLVKVLSSKTKAIDQDKTYTNKNNPFNVSLSEKTNQENLISIKMDGYELSWQINNTLDTDSVVTNNVDEAKPFTQTELNKLTSEVIYKNAFLNADLRYNLSFKSLKEEIILHQVPTFDKVEYTINVENLKAKLDENNDVIFYDINNNSKEVFKISAPFAYDAAEKPEYNKNIKVELEETDNGYIIINNLDMKWLNDSSRIYPVTIDPTVTSSQAQTNIEDSHVNSGNPNTNYVMSSSLVLGKNNGSNRTLIKITTMPTIPTGSTITNATLNAALYSGTYSWGALEVYRLTSSWNSYTVTWNNHNSISKTYLHGGITPTYSSPYHRYNINVTDTVKSWYANNMSNNWGFMLKYQDENYNDYNWLYSSDSGIGEAYRPAITITYNPVPQTSYRDYNWLFPTVSPYNKITQGYIKGYMENGHNAIDVGGAGVSPLGAPIRAAQSGTVVYRENNISSAGYWVVIETNDRSLNSNNVKIRYGYMHMQSNVQVSTGQWVNKGDLIGYVGNSGTTYGPHLHYEIIIGNTGTYMSTYRFPDSSIDPREFYSNNAYQ